MFKFPGVSILILLNTCDNFVGHTNQIMHYGHQYAQQYTGCNQNFCRDPKLPSSPQIPSKLELLQLFPQPPQYLEYSSFPHAQKRCISSSLQRKDSKYIDVIGLWDI